MKPLMNPCVARDLWMRPESVWRNSGRFFLESTASATGQSLAERRGQFHPSGAGKCASGGTQEDWGDRCR